jgi:hypothetical protein
MGRLSAKLRSVEGGIGFWCPGCDESHVVMTGPGGWQWDGNVDAPTISPSVLVTSGHYLSTHKLGDSCWCTYNEKQAAGGEKPSPFKCERCHSFVRAGQIQFLGDCTHALNGKTVPLPDWPHAEDGYGGV